MRAPPRRSPCWEGNVTAKTPRAPKSAKNAKNAKNAKSEISGHTMLGVFNALTQRRSERKGGIPVRVPLALRHAVPDRRDRLHFYECPRSAPWTAGTQGPRTPLSFPPKSPVDQAEMGTDVTSLKVFCASESASECRRKVLRALRQHMTALHWIEVLRT